MKDYKNQYSELDDKRAKVWVIGMLKKKKLKKRLDVLKKETLIQF